MALTVAEFFAGTGAFSHGLSRDLHFRTIFANDFDKSCKVIFDANHNTKMTLKDIHDLNVDDIPSMDVMTCGFPCQPFSIAGKQQGFDDKRSNVFWKMCDIIEHHQPKVIVLENVKNLVGHDRGNTFKTIKLRLKDLGYHLKHKVLNTSAYTGIPQNRERIFIVGFKSKEHADNFEFPSPREEVRPLSDFIQGDAPDKYYYSDSTKIWDMLRKEITKREVIYQYRRVYVRENKSGMCPTLTANMGGGGHNVPIILDDRGIRKLTPRECFSFQGFPSTYILPKTLSDTALYKLSGNAVTVAMIELIGKKIHDAMSSSSTESTPESQASSSSS
jgi:DNA (cytosine-5)-methyltransferase 1